MVTLTARVVEMVPAANCSCVSEQDAACRSSQRLYCYMLVAKCEVVQMSELCD